MAIELDGQHLHLGYPETGTSSDSLLDGSITPIQGPLVWPHATISVKAISPQELDTRTMYSGKVAREGTMELSEDGRTLVVESWTPDNPDEKDRLIYEKQ
jgi:hypothetical protein